MGTRGHLGGLAEATLQAVLLLDASGKDVVFVETVGAGQSEVEVTGIADTVAARPHARLGRLGPGVEGRDHGDPGRHRDQQDGSPGREDDAATRCARSSRWHDPEQRPAILLTEALTGENVPELWTAIESHRASLEASGELEERRRKNLAAEVFAVASSRARRTPARRGRGGRGPSRPLAQVEGRELDPLTAVQRILEEVFERSMAPTLADVEARPRAPRRRRARDARCTRPRRFSRLAGRQVFLKAENLQRTGSFKIRGAYNTIATLGEAERRAGVVAASAGNHGQAVAWAAREAGIAATIFMPEDAPMAKVEATRSYGGITELSGGDFEEAVAAAQAHVERTGATLVHAFEDERVIAGQGTIGLELAEQSPDAGDRADPDRGRRPRFGDRARAEGAARLASPSSA